ncbi:MAG: DinB family protein [Acidobacteriaceae bacterium]
MHSSSMHLRKISDIVPARLKMIPLERQATKPGPGKWSAKEELGHLIDSAANNHQKIVRAHLDENSPMPGYDGDRWVELHRYQERDWNELVQLWRGCNLQLAAAAESILEIVRARPSLVNTSAPTMSPFSLDGYLEHMLHHLRHIGVEVEDLLPTRLGPKQ